MDHEIASYQNVKPARLRNCVNIRSLVRETRISKDNLVMPIFFNDRKGSEPVSSMPGIEKMDERLILKEIEKLQKLGIRSVLLFGSSKKKNGAGTASFDEKSPFHRAIKRIKANSDISLILDVCLCAYTDHGHCGILKKSPSHQVTKSPGKDKEKYTIDSQETLKALAEAAVSYASAGADMVAPSAMADGQVKAIREVLDKKGYNDVSIMSYSAKYASSFYGPFRDVCKSGPVSGDRKSYQMDPANRNEALKEAIIDVNEGADIIMVKPALTCLDIISSIKERLNVPVAAYNVSGEYSMIKAASRNGWLDEESCAMEILTAIKRAGADIIISYWAKEAVEWLKRRG